MQTANREAWLQVIEDMLEVDPRTVTEVHITPDGVQYVQRVRVATEDGGGETLFRKTVQYFENTFQIIDEIEEEGRNVRWGITE